MFFMDVFAYQWDFLGLERKMGRLRSAKNFKQTLGVWVNGKTCVFEGVFVFLAGIHALLFVQGRFSGQTKHEKQYVFQM